MSAAGYPSVKGGNHCRRHTTDTNRIMKTLKFTIAAVATVASAWIVTAAAEALLSPRAAANATRVSEGTNSAPSPAASSHSMGCMAATHASAGKEPMAHCKTMKMDHAGMSCCK